MRVCTAPRASLRTAVLGKKLKCAEFVVLCELLSATAAMGGGVMVPGGEVTRLERGEPFASTSIGALESPLPDKWQSTLADIQSENAVLGACGDRPDQCPSRAAARFLRILERARSYDGFAKLAVINSGVNAAIQRDADVRRPGIEDPWPTALATFTAGRGACIHFAIAKYTALLLGGWQSSDVRLVIVWPEQTSEPHMVLAARHNGKWYILDNVRSAVLIDAKLRSYIPLLVFDHLGARQLAAAQFVQGNSRDKSASVHPASTINVEPVGVP
jgi:predicted transglutaminase-like cysteine proteinase